MGEDACVKRQSSRNQDSEKENGARPLVFEFVLNYSTSLDDVTGHLRWAKCHLIESC